MAEFDYPNGELLVSAAWLAQHHSDPQVKIIDARSTEDYAQGHIPRAVLLPNGAFRSTHGVPDACTPEEFAATASALGIQATDTVVCYDGTGGARTGGYSRASATGTCAFSTVVSAMGCGGHPTSTDVVEPSPVVYQLGTVQDDLACSLAQAEVHVQANDVLFWDVLRASMLVPTPVAIRQNGVGTFRGRSTWNGRWSW